MDDKLKKLLELYEETPASLDGANATPGADPELQDFAALKKALDDRTPARPRPETIGAVMAAARAAHDNPRRSDRGAIRRRSRFVLRSGMFASVVLALGLSVWLSAPTSEAPLAPRDAAQTKHRDELQNRAADPALQRAPVPEMLAADRAPVPEMLAADHAAGSGTIAESSPPSAGARRAAPIESHASAFAPSEGEERPEFARAAEFLDAETDEEPLANYRQVRHDEVLSWDHSDELEELYEHVQGLYAISPTGDQWRATPARRVLTAPVGLARPQHASARIDD